MGWEEIIMLGLVAGSCLLTAFLWGTGLWHARRVVRRSGGAPLSERAPFVSVLKPLSGADDALEQNLASFAELDYPNFELLLGIADPGDSARPTAERIRARFPHVRIRIIVTDPDAAPNPKVAQLICLERHAVGEILAIADSNVRVERDYLDALCAPLADEAIGLVTSTFAGKGEQTLGAALDNWHLAALIAPSVLVSDACSSRPLTVGKSMAFRRKDAVRLALLPRAGAFLAEDHVMGTIVRESGMRLGLAVHGVTNINRDASLRTTLDRHTRWAKMRRALVPRTFYVELVMCPMLVAALAAAVVQTKSMLALALGVAFAQSIAGFVVVSLGRGERFAWRHVPMEIVRSAMLLVCWLRAVASRDVMWRGHRIRIGPMTRIEVPRARVANDAIPAPADSGVFPRADRTGARPARTSGAKRLAA